MPRDAVNRETNMAKAAIKSSDSDKKKKTKSAGTDSVRIKVKLKGEGKKKKDGKSGKGGKGQSGASSNKGFDGIAKLVDHPLIADLLAAGALAAVTAIAEQQLGKNKGATSSSRMVKDAGKAAAAAIGKRLMGDLTVIGEAAANAARKA